MKKLDPLEATREGYSPICSKEHGAAIFPQTVYLPMSAPLNAEDLAEMLKWPFCVGEAQKLVFSELEKKIREKTGRTFDGDVWKFVKQVDSLGIKGLDRKILDMLAKRPKAEDALKELEAKLDLK